MAIEQKVKEFRGRLEAFDSEYREPIRDATTRMEQLKKAVERVSASWSGSTFESYYDMYYSDFDVPPSGHGLNPLNVALSGMPPGWRSRTTEEVQAHIEQLAGCGIQAVQKKTEELRDAIDRFREELIIELAPLRRMDGLEEERGLLEQIEKLTLEESPTVYANRELPKTQIATIYEVGQHRRLPSHIYFGGVLFEAESRVKVALEFIRLGRRLIRQLESQLDTEAKDQAEVVGDVQVEEESLVSKRKVFVIHGRNSKANQAIFEFLRSLDLQPIEWEDAVAATGIGSPYIMEVLNAAFSSAQATVVLLTGDDKAMLREELRGSNEPAHETELTPQPRPNVLFEAGMAFGWHPERTILIQLQDVRPFSDASGLHYVRFDGSEESRNTLKTRLRTVGCDVKDSGDAWLTAGDFSSIGNQKGND